MFMKRWCFLCTISIGFFIVHTTHAKPKASDEKSTNKKTVEVKKGTKVDISAEILQGGKGERGAYQCLQGNAVFILEDVTIYADRAVYYNDEEIIEAEGAVKIVQKDGTIITANALIYDKARGIAKLFGGVVYESEDVKFYTDNFDYNVNTERGVFKDGGMLVNKENTLTSKSGYYDNKNKMASFSDDVELFNNDYRLECKNLTYDITTKIAKFNGHTTITNKENDKTFSTDCGGEYNTRTKQASSKRGVFDAKEYVIHGDVIKFDDEKGLVKITGGVSLIAKDSDVVIMGDYCEYRKSEDVAELYGNALMTKALNDDILYMSADVFWAKGGNNAGNTQESNLEVSAGKNVKFYKTDLQGKADHMVYKEKDEKIYLEGTPVFWNYDNQLSANSAYVTFKNKEISEMHMDSNAFFIFRDKLENFNQLKGKEMIAYFAKNNITHMTIDGNADTLYFFVDDNNELKGYNSLQCSKIVINMHDGNIDKIQFPVKSHGVFYPLDKSEEPRPKLINFNWRISERPTRKDVVEHEYGKVSDFEQFKIVN